MLQEATEHGALMDWPGLVCELDSGGHFQDLSPAFAAALGESVAQLRGRPCLAFVHPDDWARFSPAAGTFKVRCRRADGVYLYLRWETRPSARGLLCVVHDLTEAGEAERRFLLVEAAAARVLAQSESIAEAAEGLLEAVCQAERWQLGALWWIDPRAGVARCETVFHFPERPSDELEEATRRMTFRRGDGLPGRVWELGAPVWIDDVRLEARFPRAPIAAAVGLRCAFALPVRSRGEIIGILEFFGDEVRPPDPLMIQMMHHVGGLLALMTERKGVEAALHLAEKRLEHVVAGAPLVLFATDVTGRLVLHQGGDLGSEQPGHLLGKSLFDLYPDPTHAVHRNVARALAGETFTELVELPPGRFHDTRYAPFRDAGGAIVGAIGVAIDATDRHAAEIALEASRLELIEANRLASLGTMAACVAHEIDNPLAYVRLCLARLVSLDLAHAGDDPVAAHHLEMLQDAREGVNRVTRIAGDLKTVGKTSEEERGPVDMRRCLDAAIRMAAHEIQHRARLLRDYADAPPAHGDEGRLGQVFVNLLLNAAQAIPEGRPEGNEIRVALGQDAAGRVVVVVADTGAGMPQDVARRAFEPFFSTKPGSDGRGLGLSIAHGIVTAHGGDIAIDSRLGEGTTFTVSLPASEAVAA